jgi:Ca2+-dependent lipid-binding protein
MARFRRRVRDDVQRELVKTSLPAETESAEWLNHFLERFWRIYEPVLSASIVNFGDQLLSANCPPFLDSIQLSTFTLGNKSFKITKVHTSPHAEEENVVMEWGISFQPSDTSDMTQDEIKKKVNSKIVLSIRLGKGLATASMPVLLEDLSFSGLMRVRMKLMTSFPHIQLVDLSFLGEPHFDYSLKPIGGDTFGFDIAHVSCNPVFR